VEVCANVLSNRSPVTFHFAIIKGLDDEASFLLLLGLTLNLSFFVI